MSWLDAVAPARMKRVALVAADDSLRDVLVRVADAAAVEIGLAGGEASAPAPAAGEPGPAGEAARRLRHADRPVTGALLSASPLDFDAIEQAGRYELLAGEAQLEVYAATAVRRSGAAALPGWIPADRLTAVAASVAEAGGAVVPLPYPPGVQPPTAVAGRPLRRALSPLVQTYGTVPYADVDPIRLAWATYVLMFGMMFGDAGEGVVLLGVAAALRAGWPRLGPPVQAGVAVRRGCRAGGHRVRPAVRGMLRADRPGAGAMDQPAGSRRSRCCWWRPASGRSCSRVPTRSARSTGGGKAAGPPRCTRRRVSPEPRCSSARASWPADGTSITACCSPRAAARPGRAGAGRRRLPRRGGRRGRGPDPGRGRALRPGGPAGLQRGVVHPARRVRPDACRSRPARMGGHACAVAPRRAPRRGRGGRLRGRDRAGVQPGSARRRHPGAPPGVLRAVLAGLRHPGPAVPAMARADGDRRVRSSDEGEST